MGGAAHSRGSALGMRERSRGGALERGRDREAADRPPYNCYFVEVVGTQKYCYCFSHKTIVKL